MHAAHATRNMTPLLSVLVEAALEHLRRMSRDHWALTSAGRRRLACAHRRGETNLARCALVLHVGSRGAASGRSSVVTNEVAMLLELADRLSLVRGERLQLGVERVQLDVGALLPSPDRHQLAVLDVAQPCRSQAGTDCSARVLRGGSVAAQRDRRVDRYAAGLAWQGLVNRRVPRSYLLCERPPDRPTRRPPQTARGRLARSRRVLVEPLLALAGQEHAGELGRAGCVGGADAGNAGDRGDRGVGLPGGERAVLERRGDAAAGGPHAFTAADAQSVIDFDK